MAKNTKSKKSKNKGQWSSYWLDDSYTSLDLSDRGANTGEALRLASVKRAIANFVRIVTGKSMPVYYNSGKDSYTEGTAVIISADTKKKNFDSVVGLALHEASHILLTSFDFLKNFKDSHTNMIPMDILRKARARNFTNEQIFELFKLIMNILEDRWIDSYMYRTVPGYRPYYEAMYDIYFRDKQIDYAMQQGEYKLPDGSTQDLREPTVDNYLFYILNLTNPWFDTRALPDLDLIYGIIDLDNINRIDARKDVGYNYANNRVAGFELDKMPLIFQLTCRIVEIILNNSDPLKKQPKQQQQQAPNCQGDPSKEDNLDLPRAGQQSSGGGTGKGQLVEVEVSETGDGDESQAGDGDESQAGDGDESQAGDDAGDESQAGDDAGDEKGSGPNKNDEKKDEKKSDSGDKGDIRKSKLADKKPSKSGKINDKKLKKAVDRQKDFVDGKVKKKKVSKSMQQQVKALEQSGASLVSVPYADTGSTRKTQVLVLRELTAAIMETGRFPFTSSHWTARAATKASLKNLIKNPLSEQAVCEGLKAGSILANRLAIRNQNQLTKYNRRNRGNLDKRRLSALGHDDESVFFRLKLTEFKPVHLHMTLDASGSMSGQPWRKALMVAVALAVAADKIENLELTVSMRAGVGNYACIAIIYDSRKDTVAKIKQLFQYLHTTGVTPEGLTYAAIMNELLGEKADDKYFINLSDGMPWYEGYSGAPAWSHTREQVNRLKGEGIKVLSYFITDGHYGDHRAREGFTKMYGKDASFIDVQKIPSLVTTLNKLFLQR